MILSLKNTQLFCCPKVIQKKSPEETNHRAKREPNRYDLQIIDPNYSVYFFLCSSLLYFSVLKK